MMSPLPACPSGIYAITNTTNGKQYIGSAVNIRKRWNKHRRELNKGIHHSPPLQRAWAKYGADAFTFTVLEYVSDVAELIAREQFYMDARFAVTSDNGYNARPMAKNNLGYRRTAESRRKLSERYKGRSITWADKLRGRVVSDETRRKLSENAKKQVQTPESNARRSATLKGKPKSHYIMTAEAIAARRSNIKATHTPESRAKALAARRSMTPTAKQLAYWNRSSKPNAITQPFLWPDES